MLFKDENGFNATNLDGRIYIIDDKKAYLGSLNFTGGGTKGNHETRVRLTDSRSIQKISEEFDYVLYETKLPKVDIQEWGGELYREPIN